MLYNTSRLVTEVKKNNLFLIKLLYNNRGHRIKKEINNQSTGSLIKSEYYVRDASGGVLAIYNGSTVSEHSIFGNSRLGVYFRSGNTSTYEPTDHLGKVRALVGRTGGTPGLKGASDYYPGRMAMPGRNVVGDYRYNYQGQELDQETGKVAFEARLYDPRINRWLTVDPAHEFFSPYMAMGNNWVSVIDPDGRCTTCPDNAKPGDTFNHPELGTVTFTESGGWTDGNGASILDDVVVFSVGKDATVKVLTETDGIGHTYIQIGNNIVFSNGRYNGSDSPSMGAYGLTGDNVLIKKTGQEAQDFLSDRTNKYPTTIQTVNNVNASEVYKNLNNRYNNGASNPNGTGVIDGRYNLLLSNCTTSTAVALKAGGVNVHAIAPKALPVQINLHNQGIDPKQYFENARFEALRGPKF
ncbi:hypothetical protein W5A_10487 [Imtechella halotolerans K1]|uniref:RHS repeat-associated core domain-containing protein n=1 Tax=Imtechella halotolerans K1 TaxID=946077 RepID=I0WB98_9FLAO|nr:hypothetical protein W5A_10487 [Imtechella halotolerans K1]